jgi:hypothetical protein
MDAKTQIAGMVRKIRIFPGSRAAMTPVDPGMTAGVSVRLPGFGPGLPACQGILNEMRHSSTFSKLNYQGLGK